LLLLLCTCAYVLCWLLQVHKEEESAKEAATNALKSQQFSNLLVQANLRVSVGACQLCC
jgi:hypothetical protein